MTDKTISYCENMVRTHDRDRYLLGLCAPPSVRPDLWPLFAFNYEIARTKETVSESTLGLIRLQWWRDAITKAQKNDILAHEVVTALAPVIKKYSLEFSLFDEMLEAREFDLHNKQPESLSTLEDYAIKTNMPLNHLCLRIIGQECDEQSLRDVSAAYGLCGIVRAAPFHASQGRNYMPADLWPADAPRLVAERAKHLLRETTAPLPRFMRAQWSLTMLYLRRLSKLKHNPGDPRLHLPPAGFALRALIGLI